MRSRSAVCRSARPSGPTEGGAWTGNTMAAAQRLDRLEVGGQADEVGDDPVELHVVGSDEPDVERVGPGAPEALLEGDPAVHPAARG